MIRSILWTGFFLLIALGSFFSGSGELKRVHEKKKIAFNPLIPGIMADRDLAVREHKPFTIVLYAHNAADWCERALISIFEQDYDRYRLIFIDDASSDDTFSQVQQFIVQNQQDARVIAIRNETPLGFAGCLYRAVDYCQDSEIVIPLDAKDWLSHDRVLMRWNQVFQNPDTWLSFSESIDYPSYQIQKAPSIDRSLIEKKGFRALDAFHCSSIAFYATLFKSIHLPSLFVNGQFSQSQFSYVLPLLEQSGGRYRMVEEPMAFRNLSLDREILPSSEERALLQSQAPYRPFTSFPKSGVKADAGIDMIVFSFDRPLQLYAALESIDRYVTGYRSLKVIYRASDDRFSEAYRSLKTTFPKVQFIQQSQNPRKDFKPLLTRTLSESSSEYIIFGVDDMIIKDYVDLNLCRQMLEKTGAYGFYLRFGRHIHQCYMMQKPQAVPMSVSLSQGIYAWDLRKGECDWRCVNSMDMTLYRKKDIQTLFSEMKYKNPNSLEVNWSQHPPECPIGLYFEQSKMVNIPLNLVHLSDCPHMNYMTTEELLVKFNQGFKIDIEPFYQIENPSPHCDYIPEFIPR